MHTLAQVTNEHNNWQLVCLGLNLRNRNGGGARSTAEATISLPATDLRSGWLVGRRCESDQSGRILCVCAVENILALARRVCRG